MNTINQGFENVPLANLKPHPRNVNQGDFGAIQESIEQNGFFGAVTANRRTGHILAGNHRYKVAKEHHAASIPVIWVDVDAEAELRILLADNRTARLGHDDENALAALLSELALSDDGLKGTGFDGDDLDDIIGRMAGGVGGGSELLTDPDDVPENAPTRCNAGDLWQLGRHRLLCGDSTKREDVERLMGGEKVTMVFCDPPYGIAFDAGKDRGGPFGGKKAGGKHIASIARPDVIGDESTETAEKSAAIALEIFPQAVHIWWGANNYAFCLPGTTCWIVWDKNNGENDFADAELAWCSHSGAVRLFRHTWNGMVKDSERGERRVHPTQKPVALAEWCIEKYGKPDGVMLDQFGGSGMSLMACEKKGWSWRGIEMSADYCDVILARWERATGQAATLLEAGNGN